MEGGGVGEILNGLKDMGISIALDNFGTGYASLAHLKRFPIDALKIDRSFVEGVPGDEEDAAVVRAIIAMSHGLGIKVIAQGVESGAQKRFLFAEGCDEAPGSLCALPSPPEQFPRDGIGVPSNPAGG
jgi:EAL domain-containing protein (putative c-di-GMP-specific phosphodiesterase class I)